MKKASYRKRHLLNVRRKWTNLIKKRPTVSTNPPTTQETRSANGISVTHCWKSSSNPLCTLFGEVLVCDLFHESAMESRLACPPQQDAPSTLSPASLIVLTEKPAARQSSVPLWSHSEALPHTKSPTPQGERTWNTMPNQETSRSS